MSTTTQIILIVLLAILIFLSALFSATETAYSSVSKTKIETNVAKGKKTAILIKKHSHNFGLTLATILICNNLVNIGSSALITYLFSSMLSSSAQATIVATFVMTPIIVVFGEIIPKLFAKKHAYGYLTKVVYVMQVLNVIFFPIIFPIKKIALGTRVTNTENQLKTFLQIASREGVLQKKEATLAENALDLDSRIVSSLYTPKKDIVFITTEDPLAKIKSTFRNSGYSRLPIKNKEGRYIGVVLLKDIIFKKSVQDIHKYIVKIPYVSKNSIATSALEQMRIHSAHMAFVVPKQSSKGVMGIITFEDIIEELVGEIYDEHDKVQSLKQVELHKFRVTGDVMMSELEAELKMKFDNSKQKSVKQWIASRINRAYKTNLVYTYKNKVKFKIISNRKQEISVIEVVQK